MPYMYRERESFKKHNVVSVQELLLENTDLLAASFKAMGHLSYDYPWL